MAIREQDLEGLGAIYGTFKVQQVQGKDLLKDKDIGKSVTLTGNNQVSPGYNGALFFGKLVDLSLTDEDQGKRVATVQFKEIVVVPVSKPFPELGNKVVCGPNGTVKKAPAMQAYIGGSVDNKTPGEVHIITSDHARGLVISKNYSSNGDKKSGEIFCTLIL